MLRWGLAFALWLSVFALPCAGETRWCSVTVTGEHPLTYPAIARAAQVSGTVIERVTFSPQGKVLQVDRVIGPLLLDGPIRSQLLNWELETDARGEEPCQALIVADFAFGDAPRPVAPNQVTSMLHISVRTSILVLDTVMYERAAVQSTRP